MKTNWSHLDKWRFQEPPYLSAPGSTFGAFQIRRNGVILQVIATDGVIESTAPKGPHEDWEHVSASAYDTMFRKERTPRWEEMCFLKDQFWNEDEVVIQFHPAKSDYVNIHDFVLHLWRWKKGIFPTPPKICV